MRWIIPHFYDITWLIFETLCPVTFISSTNLQGGRGHWDVYYSKPQSLTIMFSYSLTQQPWRLIYFDWLVHWVECPNDSICLSIYPGGMVSNLKCTVQSEDGELTTQVCHVRIHLITHTLSGCSNLYANKYFLYCIAKLMFKFTLSFMWKCDFPGCYLG